MATYGTAQVIVKENRIYDVQITPIRERAQETCDEMNEHLRGNGVKGYRWIVVRIEPDEGDE